jgi:two-component system, response regulator
MNGALEILIVEDNPRDLEMTVRALKRHNLANRVLALGDGQAALDYLCREGEYAARDPESLPNVIFLDLKLPKVDGLEVLRRIKSDPKLKLLPVVMLTSSSQERDRIESYDLGVNSFVVKPIDFESFASTIAQLGFYWLVINEPPQ